MMVTMTTSQGERDHARLQRRREVLKLPVVPLEHHGFLAPSDRAEMKREPDAVGVGPDGTAFVVWSHRKNSRRKQVTGTSAARGSGLSAPSTWRRTSACRSCSRCR